MADVERKILVDLSVIDNYNSVSSNVDRYKNRVQVLNGVIEEQNKELKEIERQRAKGLKTDAQAARETTRLAQSIQKNSQAQKEAIVQQKQSERELKKQSKTINDAIASEDLLNKVRDTTMMSLKDMQTELMELNSISLEKLSDEQIGTLKKRIVELNDAIRLSRNEAKGLTTSTISNLASSLQSVTALGQVLVGVFGKNSDAGKKLSETLVRLISLTQGLGVISQVLQYRKLSLFASNLKLIKTNILRATTTKAVAAAESGAMIASKGWTLATKALGLAFKAIPIIAVVAGIAALVGWFASFNNESAKLKKSIKNIEVSLSNLGSQMSMLTSIENVELEKENIAYNKNIKALKERGATQKEIREEEIRHLDEINRLRNINIEHQKTLTEKEVKYQQELVSKYTKLQYKEKANSEEWIEYNEKIRTAMGARGAAQVKYWQIQVSMQQVELDHLDARLDNEKILNQEYISLSLKRIDIDEQVQKDRLKQNEQSHSNNVIAQLNYNKNIYEIENKSALARIAIQRKEKGLTIQQIEELNAEEKLLLRARSLFYTEHQKQLSETFTQLLEQEGQEQIKILKETYKDAITLLEQENAQLDKNSESYEENILNIELLKKKRDELISSIEQKITDGEISKIEQKWQRFYEKDLIKYTHNEEEKLNTRQELLEKQVGDKSTSGLDSSEEEIELLNIRLKLIEINTDKEISLKAKSTKQRRDLEVNGLNEQLEALEKSGQDTADLKRQINKNIASIELEYQQVLLEQWSNYTDSVLEIMSSISSIFSEYYDARIERAEHASESEKALLQNQLENNYISQEEFDRKVKESNDRLQKEKAKAARKQAMLERAVAIADIGIKTALALAEIKLKVAAALATPPPPVGAVFGAIAAIQIPLAIAAGAAQIAAIMAKPIPQAASGGLIKGASHNTGGALIEAEGGEAIINKRSSAMFLPLLSAINEVGGGVPFASSLSDGGFSFRAKQNNNNNNLTPENISNIVRQTVDAVKIYVAVEEINDSQNKYAQIQDNAIF